MTEETLFAEALELPPEERAAFLDENCGDDAELRGRVEILLRSHDQADSFLAKPAEEEFEATLDISVDAPELIAARSAELRKSQAAKPIPPKVEPRPDDHEPPSVVVKQGEHGERILYFGDYELQGEIARGAMGVVYRGEQKSLKRTVAIKMIRSTLLTNEMDVVRFKAEAEAAASLDHPNIVPIYEVGMHDEQHYFTMKLIEGGTLRDHLEEFRERPKAAAKLMSTVAGAIHAAHQRGILHRDLKPGNILTDEAGEPHVTDFGLAKQMESNNSVTLSGQIMGTPQYMAPEQAEGGRKDLTTAADVYALGAIFYEMLCGRPPHQGESLMETLKLVAEEEALPPSRHHPKIDHDLETIVMKCLEKDPARRYASAQGLKNDLDRWIAGEPIEARPVGTAEKAFKWMKRKPMHAAAAGVTFLFLLTLGIGGPIAALKQARLTREANDAKTVAEVEREAARQALARSALSLAEASLREGDGPAMRVALNEVPENLRDSTWNYLLGRSDSSILCLDSGPPINGVAAHPQMPHVFVAVDQQGTVFLLDVTTGKRIREFTAGFPPEADGGKFRLALSPDGMKIAIGRERANGIVIHDARDGTVLNAWETPGTESLDFSPDGALLAQNEILGGGKHRFKIWDASTGQRRWDFVTKAAVTGIFSPQISQCVLTLTPWEGLRLMDAGDGSVIRNFEVPRIGRGVDMAVSPDGNLAVLSAKTGLVIVLDLQSGRRTYTYSRPDTEGRGVVFTPDGKCFVTVAMHGSGRQLIHIRRADRGASVHAILGGSGEVSDLSVHPVSGELFVAGAASRVWNLTGASMPWVFQGPDQMTSVTFWHSDDLVFAPSSRPDPKKRIMLHRLEMSGSRAVWTPRTFTDRSVCDVTADGREAAVAASSISGGFEIQFLQRGSAGIESRGSIPLPSWPRQIHFAPAGDRLVVITVSNNLQLIERSTGEESVALGSEGIVTCQDVEWINDRFLAGLVTAEKQRGLEGSEERVVLWDTYTGKIVRSSPHPAPMEVLAVSPDGRRLAEAGGDKLLRIRDSVTLEVQREFRVHDAPITALAWHPFLPILATGSEDLTVRLWDSEDTRLLAEFRGPFAPPVELEFSPSGRFLGCASQDARTRIWEPEILADGEEVTWRLPGEGPSEDELVNSTAATDRTADIEVADSEPSMDSLLRSGNWRNAVEHGRHRLAESPTDKINWLQLACALILAEDLEGYADFRERLIQMAPDVCDSEDSVGNGRILIKACLLLPSGKGMTDRLPLAQVEKSVGSLSEGSRMWLNASLALVALRSGDLERAVELTNSSGDVMPTDTAPSVESLNLAIRPLALGMAGEIEPARESLEKTQRILETKPEDGYHNWLIADILRREAEAVLAEREGAQ